MARAQTTLFAETAHGDLNIVDQELCVGTVFFVDSNAALAGDTVYHGRSRSYPFATLAYAVTQVTTGRGDWIVLSPGHAENVAAAGAIDINAANVTIIGAAGHGLDLPTITFTAALSDINLDGDGVKFKNVRFVNTQDANAAPIDVNAAGAVFDNCIFEDDGADNTIVWILADANADYLEVRNCINRGTDTAGNTAWISLGAANHVRLVGNQSNGDFAAGNMIATAAPTDILIDRNWLENANAVDVNIELFAAATGFVTRNYLKIATDAQVTWLNTQGNVMVGENYGVNNNGENGALVAPGGVSV